MLTNFALAAGLVLAVPLPDNPRRVELFAAEAWYRNEDAREQEFVGLLTRFARPATGSNRYNPYRLLLDGKKEIREVHVADKVEILAAYVGRRVRIVGKVVDAEGELRRHREIWPARLEVLEEAPTVVARRFTILGLHKNYPAEPAEKVVTGVLRKSG